MAIYFVTFYIGAEILDLDLNNPTRFLEKLFFGIFVVALMASMLFFAAMIVFIVKRLTSKTVDKYVPPQVSANAAASRPEKITSQMLYGKDDIMYLGNAAEPMTWLRVGVFLVFLCPMGVFLAIRKVIEEKTHYYENGQRLIIFGVIMMVLTAPMLYVPIKQDQFDPISLAFVIPLLLALLMLVFGFVFKHKGKVNNDYMILLKIDRITGLDEIARIMKTDYAHAAAVIQNLIDSDLLRDAYIYHKDRAVIIFGISEKIALKCKSCGATTVLYKTDKHECVYCGAEI